jgi:hypothetical protein
VGLAQYTLRQYDEAEGSFEAVRAADPYRLQCMDTYSNILYVKVSACAWLRVCMTVSSVFLMFCLAGVGGTVGRCELPRTCAIGSWRYHCSFS